MRRRNRIAIAAGGAVLVVAIVLGVLGYGLTAGWFDSGSVTGSTAGFETAEAPVGAPAAGAWPEYGFDQSRSRANPALDLAPPFRTDWRFDAGSLVEFPPVLGGGRAFVGTNAGLAIALDSDTGRRLWQVPLRGRVASSPAISGDTVLFTTIRGDVLALRAADGRPVWRRRLGGAVESSPLVVHGSVYVGTLAGSVVRLDARTGGIRWRARAAGDVKASLALSGPDVVVGDYAGKVTAFRRADGTVAWQRTSPGERLRGSGRFYGGPAIAYGRVYEGNVNGRMLALDARTGRVAWVRVLSDYIYSSPAVADRLVYVGSYDHHLYALDAVSGTVRWSFDAGDPISGSPSVVGGVVYFSTLAANPRNGRTYGLDARTGRRLWTFPDGRYSPAVAVRGLLVVAGVRTIYGLRPR